MANKWCEVDCKEIHTTREENWDYENPSVRVTLQVMNANRLAAVKDLLSNRRPYPFNTSLFPRLYAQEASVSMDRARYTASPPYDEVINYSYDAFLTVTYKPLYGALYLANSVIDGMSGHLYVEESFEPDLNFITFDYREFRYAGSKKPFSHGSEGGWPLYKEKVMHTVHGYNTLPVNIEEWEGKWHTDSYRSDVTKRIYPANTLLCTNVKIRRSHYNYTYGNPGFSITAELIYMPITDPQEDEPWNLFPKLNCSGDEAKIEYVPVEGLCDPDVDTSWKPFEPYTGLDLSDFIFDGDPSYGSATLVDPNTWTPS